MNDGVALFGKGTPQLHSCCIVATLESGSPILEWPRDSRSSNADGKEERCDKVACVVIINRVNAARSQGHRCAAGFAQSLVAPTDS